MKKDKIAIITTLTLYAIVLLLTISKSKAEPFHSVEQEDVLHIEAWMMDEQTWKYD